MRMLKTLQGLPLAGVSYEMPKDDRLADLSNSSNRPPHEIETPELGVRRLRFCSNAKSNFPQRELLGQFSVPNTGASLERDK
jgi:hypothetical protein